MLREDEIAKKFWEELMKAFSEEYYKETDEKKRDQELTKKEEDKPIQIPESFGNFIRFAGSDGSTLYLNKQSIESFCSHGNESEIVTSHGVYSVKERLDQVLSKIRSSC